MSATHEYSTSTTNLGNNKDQNFEWNNFKKHKKLKLKLKLELKTILNLKLKRVIEHKKIFKTTKLNL